MTPTNHGAPLPPAPTPAVTPTKIARACAIYLGEFNRLRGEGDEHERAMRRTLEDFVAPPAAPPAGEAPTCVNCGRTGTEFVEFDGAYFHLNCAPVPPRASTGEGETPPGEPGTPERLAWLVETPAGRAHLLRAHEPLSDAKSWILCALVRELATHARALAEAQQQLRALGADDPASFVSRLEDRALLCAFLAEAQQDAKRLDWLETEEWNHRAEQFLRFTPKVKGRLRAAIDAARSVSPSEGAE